MSISFKCPQCDKDYNVGDAHAGQQAKCSCGHVFLVPHAVNNPATILDKKKKSRITISLSLGLILLFAGLVCGFMIENFETHQLSDEIIALNKKNDKLISETKTKDQKIREIEKQNTRLSNNISEFAKINEAAHLNNLEKTRKQEEYNNKRRMLLASTVLDHSDLFERQKDSLIAIREVSLGILHVSNYANLAGDDIRKLATTLLSSGGMTVLSDEQIGNQQGVPSCIISIKPSATSQHSAVVELLLVQPVYPIREPALTLTPVTWRVEQIVPAQYSDVKQAIQLNLASFLKDWALANIN